MGKEGGCGVGREGRGKETYRRGGVQAYELLVEIGRSGVSEKERDRKEKETHLDEQDAHVQSAQDDRGDVEFGFVVCW